MGMFTTIIDQDGTEWQIKTGYDEMETYSVGDTVNMRIIPDVAGDGHLLDDVYDAVAYREDSYVDGWVIIKDSKVVDVVQLDCEDEGQYVRLYAQHGIAPLPADRWPDWAWAEKAKRKYELENKLRLLQAETPDMSPEDAYIHLANKCIRSYMDYPSFARMIFPVEPMTK